MKIFPLLAAHGDALIIEEESDGRSYRIVIDGGPEETADDITDLYLSLGHIDLLVLTHYDEDHISGLIRFFEKIGNGRCIVDRVWANCASIVDYDAEENACAYEDAFVLSKHLELLMKRGIVGEWRDDVTTEMDPVTVGPFQIDVISPTPKIQNELQIAYHDYLEKEGLQDDPDLDVDVSFGRVQQDATKGLTELASAFRPRSTSFMNRSSIALCIQSTGKTVLALGDADAVVVADSLRTRGASEENPIGIDLIKMSHHGSRANINKTLFDITRCNNYLFTTDGGAGGAYHPDRQTIACIDSWARKNNEPLNLYFNYPLVTIMIRNVGLLSDREKELFTIVEGSNAIIV